MPMKYGVSILTTDQAMPPDAVARAVEERGFESLWISEHPHIPVQRSSQGLFGDRGDVRDTHKRLYDLFVVMSVAAAVTTDLRIGSGICLVTEREPIVLAKAVASLDRLSGGRFLFGIGAGWLKEEVEAFGVPFARRWQVTEERVAAMKRLWQEDEAEFHSEFVDIPRTMVFPKPLQQPHSPIYLGAESPWARQRVVEWADGWLPLRTGPRRIAANIQDIRARAAGRTRSGLHRNSGVRRHPRPGRAAGLPGGRGGPLPLHAAGEPERARDRRRTRRDSGADRAERLAYRRRVRPCRCRRPVRRRALRRARGAAAGNEHSGREPTRWGNLTAAWQW